VRPADWLALPTITEDDNMFAGLLAITNDEANYIALSAAGNYTVDWGDGTIENYNSGVTAQHYYDYNNTALVGTECSRGYRQAVVKVTPRPGATFTGINLQLRHSAMSAQIYNVQWLDLAMGGAALSDIRFAQSNISPGTTRLIRINWCEQVKIVRMNRTDMSYMFYNCSSLQSVPLFNTANVTNMSYMFSTCYSLQSVPIFDTANVTSMDSMFYNCYSLQSVPLFNTANVTSMSYMFSGCYSLQSVPLFNTAKVTSMSYMFSGCYSLTSAPLAGTKISISYTDCKLSRSALVAIFNGLANITGSTAQTITIAGNFGAAQLTQADRGIALNKNWTITG
jgi:surface protein